MPPRASVLDVLRPSAILSDGGNGCLPAAHVLRGAVRPGYVCHLLVSPAHAGALDHEKLLLRDGGRLQAGADKIRV